MTKMDIDPIVLFESLSLEVVKKKKDAIEAKMNEEVLEEKERHQEKMSQIDCTYRGKIRAYGQLMKVLVMKEGVEERKSRGGRVRANYAPLIVDLLKREGPMQCASIIKALNGTEHIHTVLRKNDTFKQLSDKRWMLSSGAASVVQTGGVGIVNSSAICDCLLQNGPLTLGALANKLNVREQVLFILLRDDPQFKQDSAGFWNKVYQRDSGIKFKGANSA